MISEKCYTHEDTIDSRKLILIPNMPYKLALPKSVEILEPSKEYVNLLNENWDQIKANFESMNWRVDKIYHPRNASMDDIRNERLRNAREGSEQAYILNRLSENGAKDVALGDGVLAMERIHWYILGDYELIKKSTKEFVKTFNEELEKDLKGGETGILLHFVELINEVKLNNENEMEIWDFLGIYKNRNRVKDLYRMYLDTEAKGKIN